MHKKPPKCRFIVASSSCTTTNISKKLSCVLKAVQGKLEKYCNKIEERTGVKCMWIIENRTPFLEEINQLSNKNKLNNISTWDFSTMYTSIPHEKL